MRPLLFLLLVALIVLCCSAYLYLEARDQKRIRYPHGTTSRRTRR